MTSVKKRFKIFTTHVAESRDKSGLISLIEDKIDRRHSGNENYPRVIYEGLKAKKVSSRALWKTNNPFKAVGFRITTPFVSNEAMFACLDKIHFATMMIN